jgi:isopentenyl-diphosphate Delta-isomerase
MPKPEQVDILDDAGNPTGKTLTLTEAHKKGKWHAGVHVALYTPDRRVLLQQRSKTIMFYPGYWDLGVGGPVAAGEGLYEAAIREVEEEIGVTPHDLQAVTRWKYNHHVPSHGMHVKYVLYSFTAQIDPKQFTLQPSEVQAVKLLPIRDAHRLIFEHKGLPQIQLEPYEGDYRKLLDAIEQRFKQSPQADTIELLT